MREESRRLLKNSIDQVAHDVLDRLRAVRGALQTVLGERATTEASVDRRKRLTAIAAVLASEWDGALAVFEESFRHQAEVAAGWREDRYGSAELTTAALQLVDDDQVEWDLAYSGAVQHMKSAGGEPLGEVDQRIAALCGAAAGDGFVNPLGVDVISQGVKTTLEKLLADASDRRAILVHFEPLFSAELTTLYAELNETLAAQGVNLPQRVRAIQGSGRNFGGGGGGGRGSAGGDAGSGGDSLPGDFMELIQRLAVGAGGGAAGVSGGMTTGGARMPLVAGAAVPEGMPMVAVPAAMLDALNRIQELDLGGLQGGAIGQIAESGGNALRELRKQDFVSQLQPVEAATIDIVAMLFDFIFEDKLVPDTVKALVGRLQIPLLKVAMVDKTFFANREHPARMLLDTISKISISAGKDLGHGNVVFERIKQAVNAVLLDFEKKPGIFDAILADLRELLAEQEKLTLEIAERSRHVAEAQEREDLAQTWTERAFNAALTGAGAESVPAGIVEFLSQHWTQVLKFAYLKGGAEGHPWALAVETLNDVLWSVKAKEGPEERKKLILLLPELLRRLNAYLDRVKVDPEQKTGFLNALGELHFALIKGGRRPSKSRSKHKDRGPDTVSQPLPATPLATPPAPPAAEAPLPTPNFASVSSADLAPNVVVTRSMEEGGLEVESIALSGRVLNARPIRASDIAHVERGDWVEFVQEGGEKVRGRLSWVSPQRGILLFTNPQSSKAISISPEALALQMKRGLASKLDAAEALVDRALGKAMDSMAA